MDNLVRIVGIDPATVTGFVVLDLKGRVLVEEHVTGTKGGSKEYQIATLMFEVKDRLRPGDIVGIESFAFEATDVNKVASGNNWASRIATAMVVKSLYVSPGPGQIKKFLQISMKRGTPTKDVKLAIKKAAEQRFNYPGLISDNTADALTIAHITRYVYMHRHEQFDITTLPEHEYEVVFAVHDPDGYKIYAKEKEKNEKRARAEAREAAKAAKKAGAKATGKSSDNRSRGKDAGGIEQPDLFGGTF